MHPDEGPKLKRVTVGFGGEDARRGGADVGEEEGRQDLRREALQIQIVPRRGHTGPERVRVRVRIRVKVRIRVLGLGFGFGFGLG